MTITHPAIFSFTNNRQRPHQKDGATTRSVAGASAGVAVIVGGES
jgi:hypothetical protein